MSEKKKGSGELSVEEMEAIVGSFNDRVSEAQKTSDPSRELVKKPVQRKGAERCPVILKRFSLDLIIRYGDELADLLC